MSAPYMPLYVGDYIADTQHLTTLQHGAYLLLLMAMWRSGGRLPNNPKRLAIMSKMTLDKWRYVAPAVLDFFAVEGDFVVSKRLSAELCKYEKTVTCRREAGAIGNRVKALKRNKPNGANATRLRTQNLANQNQTPTEEALRASSDRSAREALGALIEAAPPALREGLDEETLAFVVSHYSREGLARLAAQMQEAVE